MKVRLALITIFLLSFVLSEAQRNDLPTVLDLNRMIKSDEIKSTTDIFEIVDLIPLETSEESMTKISNTVVTANDIFLFSQNQGGVLKFNRSGDYIRLIGKRGRGPGELCSPLQAMFQFYKGDIYLFDPTCKKIIKYNTDNIDFEEFSLKKNPSFMLSDMLNEDCFLVVSLAPFFAKSDPLIELTSYNSKGKIIREFPLYPNTNSQKQSIFPFVFWHFNDDIYYKSTYCDTAFQVIGPDKVQSKYVFSPGNKRFESKKMLDQEVSSGKIVVTSIFETNKYLIIDYVYNGAKRAVYDKNTGKFAQIQTSFSSSKNQLDECTFLWPRSYGRYESKVPGEYISVIEPLDLVLTDITKLNIKSESIKSKLIELKKTVDENDNPIIVIMKEKKQPEVN